ncbi:MAG: hypothetical protein AAFO83_03735 [Cyanobacteria bacterium J06607_13]
MTQSVSTALPPSADSSSADSSSAGQKGDAAHRNGAGSSQTTRLGYEVLYSNRRPGRLHLPLSLPASESSRSSTGSALLDSFERDRAQKSTPLRNLRLVAIAGLQATDPIQSVPEISSNERATEDASPQETNLAPAHSEPSEQHSDDSSRASSRTVDLQSASKPTALQSDFQPAVGRTNPAAPPAPSQSAQPQSKRPALKPQPKQPPASAPRLSARSGHFPVNTGKVARDSAAAVGLLDLNDTLLFGGDHEDLSCVDPFVAFQSSVRPAEVLDYLSHQVSAFTVERLKHNFPITTHLDVLNRVDPPAYGTVLQSQFFKLKDRLTEAISESENVAEPGPSSSSDSLSVPSANLEAVEIQALSKQVQDLNKKIEYLSRKLEETSGSEMTP